MAESNNYVSFKHGDTEFAQINAIDGTKILDTAGKMVNEDIVVSLHIPHYGGTVVIHE